MSTQVSPDKISRAVRAYFLAIRAMDADAFANTFAEDGTTCDPIGAPPITGRPAIREFLHSICKNFKSVALTEDSVRKSTRLNSSHQIIRYAVFSLKKK